MLIKMQRPKTSNLLPGVAGVNMETYRPSTWQPSQINTVEGGGRRSKGGGLGGGGRRPIFPPKILLLRVYSSLTEFRLLVLPYVQFKV